MLSDTHEKTPEPGSGAAVERGCTCAIGDNAHGAGWLGIGLYWISGDCPLHSHEPSPQDDNDARTDV